MCIVCADIEMNSLTAVCGIVYDYCFLKVITNMSLYLACNYQLLHLHVTSMSVNNIKNLLCYFNK